MHQSFEESLIRYVSEYRSLIDHSNAFRLHFSSLSTIKRLCQVRLTWVVKYQRTWKENPCNCQPLLHPAVHYRLASSFWPPRPFSNQSQRWQLLCIWPLSFMLCLVWECSVYLYVRLHSKMKIYAPLSWTSQHLTFQPPPSPSTPNGSSPSTSLFPLKRL